MDWNRVDGNWKQVRGQVKEKWGKLTDDDLTRSMKLEGKIQEPYGLAKDQVKKDVDDWYGPWKALSDEPTGVLRRVIRDEIV